MVDARPAGRDRACPLAESVRPSERIDGAVTSTATVHADEPLLSGHFPGFPIFPGIALLECAHQTVLQAAPAGSPGKLFDLTAVRRARFQRPVFPGDQLHTVAELTPDGTGLRARAQVRSETAAPMASFTLEYAHRPVARPTVEIRRLLPHRYPMLLVDRVTAVVPGESLEALKAVTINEPCYAMLADGADEAYPPTLLVESWCQAAGVLACLEQPNPDVRAGRVTLFGSITELELPGRAYPGDLLRHQVRLTRLVSDAAVLEGETTVEGTTIMRVGGVTIALRPAGTLTRPPE